MWIAPGKALGDRSSEICLVAVVPALSHTILVCIPRVTQVPGFFLTPASGMMVTKCHLHLGASTKPGVSTLTLYLSPHSSMLMYLLGCKPGYLGQSPPFSYLQPMDCHHVTCCSKWWMWTTFGMSFGTTAKSRSHPRTRTASIALWSRDGPDFSRILWAAMHETWTRTSRRITFPQKDKDSPFPSCKPDVNPKEETSFAKLSGQLISEWWELLCQ